MNIVGRAMSTIGDRMLIIRCDAAQLPGLYSEVIDRKMQTVGTIVDLFGNIKAPYATVICCKTCGIQQNETLYTKEATGKKRIRPVQRIQM